MTLKEARDAAIHRKPILFDGCRYERIAFVGIYYSDRRKEETPTIKLIDSKGRELWANPGKCEVIADGMGAGYT